ncbi:MAG: hypothetical protein AAF361_03740 [Bacteroidota bacterium]
MKALLRYIMLSTAMLTIFACSTDADNESQEREADTVFGRITYDDDIRSIMSTNCIACHANPPTNDAPMPLTTFLEVKNAVETRDLISRINSISNPMPADGRIPEIDRRKIDAWVTQGFPEN